MRSETYYAVSAAVAEPECGVNLTAVAAKEHEVDLGFRIKVNQSYLVRGRVATVVYQSYLHSARMFHTNVHRSNLPSPQRVGIVIRAELHAAHHL